MKETKTHIYFWGTEFSNLFPCKFIYKGHEFDSSEQAFMWEKAITFGDYEIADQILVTPNARRSKELGRSVSGFMKSIWDDVSYEVMIKANIPKWSQNSNLETKLLNTKGKILVEGSPQDRIWGVGLKYDDPRIIDEKNWRGKNNQGKVLMEVRDYLK